MDVSLYLYPVAAREVDIYALWQRLDEQISRAKKVGFVGVWVPEHHVAKAYFPPPFQVLTWCAARHPSLFVGTAVALPALQHPLHFAEHLVGLQTMTRGQLRVGIGSGFRSREFNGFGVEQSKRFELERRATTVIKSLLRGESESFTLGPWHATNAQLPFSLENIPPVLWGVKSSIGARVAASIADGILPGMLDGYEEQIRLLNEFDDLRGVRAHIRPILADVVIGNTTDLAKGRAIRRLGAEYGSFQHHRAVTSEVDAFARDPISEFNRLEQIAVVGTPTDLRARLAMFEQEGVGEFVARVEQANTTQAEALEAIEALGDAVCRK